MLDVSIYSKARYDGWLSALWVGSVLVQLLIGASLFGTGEVVGGGVMFAVAALYTLILRSLLPRCYEIRTDRLRIVLGWPFAVNIPFNTVEEIRAARARDALAYRGLRFATSTRTPVEVRRSKGLNMVISPHDRPEFIEKARQALSRYQGQPNTED